jgi:hypothetical protein
MKVKIKFWYPYWATHRDETEIDVPDDADPEDWICNHKEEILEKKGSEENLSYALDVGYAGVEIIKEKKE